jgi:LPXTG-site transpeptidase (sortase) family protein
MNLSSKFLILSGLLLLLFGANLISQRYSPKTLEFNNLKVVNVSNSNLIPVRIIIPSQKIDNGVYGAKITNGQWETTDKGISYLLSSPVPGAKGNSVLYGHNWESLLGKLTNIKPGQEIKIVLNNGQTRTFMVQFTSVVDPNETHILSQTKDNRITIYTCTGFLDSKRFVAIATLES